MNLDVDRLESEKKVGQIASSLKMLFFQTSIYALILLSPSVA